MPTTAVWGCNQQRTFTHQSVRQTVQLEAGGNRVRMRLTNELGLSPVRFAEVTVAASSPNGVLQASTTHVVTFGGKRSGVIPIGKAWLSDPIDMKVHRFENLCDDRPALFGGGWLNVKLCKAGEQRSENPRVGGSIPPLATTPSQSISYGLILAHHPVLDTRTSLCWPSQTMSHHIGCDI